MINNNRRIKYRNTRYSHLLSKSNFTHTRGCETEIYDKRKGYPSVLDEDDYLELLVEVEKMIKEMEKSVYPEDVAIDYSGGREYSSFTAGVSQFQTVVSGSKVSRR